MDGWAVRRIGLVGGGTMGLGIAQAFAAAGATVTLVEADPARARELPGALARIFAGAVERGKTTAEEAVVATARVGICAAVAQLPDGLDLIVEAVPEQVELKARVLAACAERRPRLLATNTSGISIDALAEGLPAPEGFLGLHFFNPVWAMALVEVVLGARTSAATRTAALAICTQIGKTAVVVRDAPGFASSRLGLILGLEAMRMVEDGVAAPADIDRAMELGYRHPMGPLKLSDLIGLDVRLDIARNLERAYGARFTPPRILIDLVAAGKLGKKTGEGFYRWDGDDVSAAGSSA